MDPLAVEETSGGCCLYSVLSRCQKWNDVKPLLNAGSEFSGECERTEWNQDPMNPIITVETLSDGSGVRINAPWIEMSEDGSLSDNQGELFDDPEAEPECVPNDSQALLNTLKIVAATSKSKIQEIIDQL